MKVEVHNAAELTDALATRWRALASLTVAFGSPLVGPDFAMLIGRHHPNAKVAVGYQDGLAVAFFGFHPAKNGYARAIGAPFCDYQAIVSDPEANVDGVGFLTAAGIGSLVFTSLMDPYGIFALDGLIEVDGYRIVFNHGSSAYEEQLRAANPKWAKNIRRLTNKMDRELGAVSLIGSDTNQASYDGLLDIKISQFRRTGMTNVLRSDWVKGVMQELFANQNKEFGGCLISLYAGEKFVAGQFGVRLGSWFHPWIASTCPASYSYSPGIVFLSETIKHADKFGLKVVDLSSGHAHYKGQFCRSPVKVQAGIIGQKPEIAPRQSVGLRALIERRLDLISSVEPHLLGQASAFGMALVGMPKRFIDRQAKHEDA